MNIATLQPALASPAPTNFVSVLPADDPIFGLIAARHRTMAAYKAQLTRESAAETAARDAKLEGRADAEALEAAYHVEETRTGEASAAEMEAWKAVLARKPVTIAGARSLIAAIQAYEFEWHNDEDEALLSVAMRLVDMVARMDPEGREPMDAKWFNVPVDASGSCILDPVKRALFENYSSWLHFERRWLVWEAADGDPLLADKLESFVPGMNEGFTFHNKEHGRRCAMDRARTVMDAIGCDWRKVDPSRYDAAEMRAAIRADKRTTKSA